MKRFAVMRGGHDCDFVRLEAEALDDSLAHGRRCDKRFGGGTQQTGTSISPSEKIVFPFLIDGARCDVMDRFHQAAAIDRDERLAFNARAVISSTGRTMPSQRPYASARQPGRSEVTAARVGEIHRNAVIA